MIKWRLVVTGNIRGSQEERICRLRRIFHDTTIGDSSFGLYLIANEWLMWGWVVGWWTRRQLQGGVLLSISSNINTLSYWLNTLGRGSGQCVVNVELRSVAVDGDREGGEIWPELIRREGINRSNPRPPVAEGRDGSSESFVWIQKSVLCSTPPGAMQRIQEKDRNMMFIWIK